MRLWPFYSNTCRRRCTWSSPPEMDPHLPLARLRARGQLTELRAVDLRFTYSEAAEFLSQVMGLNLIDRRHRRPGNAY